MHADRITGSRPGTPRACRLALPALTGAVVVALVLPSLAHAHAPRFFAERNASVDSPLRVPDGSVSIAAYGRLDVRLRALVLAVRLPAGAREPLEVLVPASGPSRPVLRVSVRRPGEAWRSLPPLARPERFFEPYGGLTYRRTHRGQVGGARGGWTLVRVALPRGADARAVCLATGSREVGFSGVDLAAALERIAAWAAG
jgi:hypothetical protein